MSTISKALPNPPANFSTTLSGGVSSSDLTIPLNSVSGLGTEGVGVIYAKDSEGEAIATSLEFIHWTNTSGNNLTLSDTGDRGLSGSYNGAQAHSSGDTFEVWVHPEYHFYDWGVTEHNADGTHKAGITLTSSTISSPTITTPIMNGAFTGTATPPLTFYGSNFNAPEGFLLNGKIVPSVASNNLTVAIKGMDGNDPSASNPVYIRIGDTVRAITAALSVTKNAGTNWCNAGSSELATKEIDYFVYIGYNATDGVVVGFSRIPYATLYSDFSATTTNEKYCAISTITNAAAGDDYRVVGRFAATLSAGAGYTWSVPTFTAANLIQRPIFETRWLGYAPSVTPGGSLTLGSVVHDYTKYRLVHNTAYVQTMTHATAGGSASDDINLTVPFAPQGERGTETNGASFFSSGWISGHAFYSSGKFVLQKYDNSGHPTSGTYYFGMQAVYELA